MEVTEPQGRTGERKEQKKKKKERKKQNSELFLYLVGYSIVNQDQIIQISLLLFILAMIKPNH